MDLLEEFSRRYRDPEPEINDDVNICGGMGNHYKDVLDDHIKEKVNVSIFRWEVYKKYQ